MSNEMERPLSTLVAQGWEVVGFASGLSPASHVPVQNVLLRRQKAHKVLILRRKTWGQGYVVTEYDI